MKPPPNLGHHLTRVAGAAILAVAAGSCATPVNVPLVPAVTAEDFQSRTLSDDRLRALRAEFLPRDHSAPGWGLTSLTLAALYFHPDLEVSRAKIGQAEAAVVTAGQIPNPELSATQMYHSVTAPSPLTIGAIVNFLLETNGRRAIRVAQAEQLAAAARQDLANTSWQVRGRVRSALITLWAAGRRSKLLAQRLEFQEQLVGTLEKQLDAGTATTLELSRERAALNQFKLTRQDFERQAAEAHAQLASAIGVPSPALDSVKISFDALDAYPRDSLSRTLGDLRRAAIYGRSDLQTLLAEYDAAQTALQLEVAKQFPNVTIGPGYQYDQGDNIISFDLKADLPIFNRNEGPIAEAEAKRREVAARFIALQAQIAGEVDVAAASYRATLNSISTADNLRATQTERRNKISKAFNRGEIDRGSYLSSEVEFAAIELARFDALVLHLQATGLVEDALHKPLFDPKAELFMIYNGATPSVNLATPG